MTRRYTSLVGLAVLVAGCIPASVSTAAPSGQPPSSSTAVAPNTLSPVPSLVRANPVSADRYQWQQASVSLGPHALLSGVAGTPWGWTAVGTGINLPDPGASLPPNADPLANLYSGIVLTSPDGLSWDRSKEDATFSGARITKVVGTSAGAWIFGLGGVCLPDACGGVPPNGGTIVWMSRDRVTWDRLLDTGLSDGAVVDVATTPGGLIAVGYAADPTVKAPEGAFEEPTLAAIWTSADGQRWRAVSGLPKAERLVRVWAQGSEAIALGALGASTVVWRSHDGGKTWSSGPTLDDLCCSTSAILDGRVLIATFDSDGIGGLVNTARASDGSWTQKAPKAMKGFRPAWAEPMGTSFVVFGWMAKRTSADDWLLVDDRPRTLVSQDGAEWLEAPFPKAWDGQAALSVSVRDRDMVAVVGPLDSVNGPPDELTTTLWLGTAD